MNQLSDRLNSLSPSATLAMSQKSAELKAQGVDVINLSVGEPDFDTPDHIKEAAKKAIDENYSRYSPVAGYPALRNAIVAKLKNENGLEYTAAQISCANGAKQSVCNTILTLVNPGDEVIVPAPYWVSYPEMVPRQTRPVLFIVPENWPDWLPCLRSIRRCMSLQMKSMNTSIISAATTASLRYPR